MKIHHSPGVSGESTIEQILNNIPGGVYAFESGGDGEPVFVNRQFLSMMGFKNEAAFRAYLNGDNEKMVHPDDVETVKRAHLRVSRGKRTQAEYQCRMVTRDGRMRPVHGTVQKETDREGHTVLIDFLVAFDAQGVAKLGSKIDPQTGLLKMHAFFSAMKNTRRQFEMENRNQQLAVLFFDVINFRKINLHYGVDAGDDFLRGAGKILQMLFPEYAVARFGGDQFAVLLEARNLEDQADRARDMIRRMAPSSVDCSVGACIWEDDAVSPEEICNRAKLACDENRKHVNTYFSYYTQEKGRVLETAEYVVSHIDEAVEKGWIQVYYQPEIRAISNQICGMEALARWIDPRRGFLSPGEFIAPLEETEQIWKLDLCVIRQVIEGIAKRERQGEPGIHISVNLSRVDFLCCDIYDEIETLIRQYDVSREMLHIEVTESTLTSNETKIFRTLNRFREVGYEIWIDDFGSGYSTLNLLKDYDFDVLKLDMDFLRRDTPRSREIVASVIAMDKRIGSMTLAEGVETAEQYEFLKKCGCDSLQGYYFSKPLPYDKALRHCLEKGIGIETVEQKPYYDAVQQVNFMTDLPMMLIEYRSHAFHVLYTNDRALSLVVQDGVETKEAASHRLNDPHNASSREIRQAVRYAVHTGRPGELYYPFHGEELLCRYRLVSRTADQYLFAVNIFDYFQTGERLSEKTHLLMNLRYFYRALFCIDPKRQTFTSVQFGEDLSSPDAGTPIRGEDGRLSDLLPSVFEADRKRYDAFIDPATLQSRLAQAPFGILHGAFRTQDDTGRYTWMSHRILSAPNAKAGQLIYAIRTIDEESASDEQQQKRESTYTALTDWNMSTAMMNRKAVLWEDLMLHMPIPLFWKDQNRKFRGANQAFLDYYGFHSLSQILDKTDEEMHWHPNDGPYHQNEVDVLRDGICSVNVPGKSIAKGVSRKICATKWPLYIDGRISGLMGYFIDAEREAELTDVKHSVAGIDPVTGLANVVGFMDSLASYNTNYQLSQRLYSVVLISVPELSRIAGRGGVKASEAVLRACAEVLVEKVNNRGIAARIGANWFAVLYAYDETGEVEKLSDQIQSGIESIHRVGDMTCTLFAKMGIVQAEEVPSFEEGLLHGTIRRRSNVPEIHEREARNKVLRELLDPAEIGCYILSTNHKVMYWNPEAERLLGYSKTQMLGKDCFDARLGCSFTSGMAVPDNRCPAIVALATGKAQTMQMFMRRSDGKDILIRNTLVPLKNAAGEIDELVALFTPLTDETYDDGMIRDLYEVATRDPVTCLPGRRYMEASIEEALESYHRASHVFAVLFADADDFHSVNNIYGHNVGDAVLQAFGIALRKYGRRIDRFCRWGGDEFVGLLQLKDYADVEGAAKRFSKVANSIAVKAEGQTVDFHISMGITAVRDDDTVQSIVDRADQYMYLSKKLPGDQVVTDRNADAAEAQEAAHDNAAGDGKIK